MKNFPFIFENIEYWYSRAAVVGMFAFCKNGNGDWCILANKRGPGCPNCVGKWNVPGGFVDFEETLSMAAMREAKEETGIDIPGNIVKLYSINSEPKGEKQNISFKFYAILPGDTLNYKLSNEFMEKDEVSDIKWIPVKDIYKFSWAFNHINNIREIYHDVVEPGLWQTIKNEICRMLNIYQLFNSKL